MSSGTSHPQPLPTESMSVLTDKADIAAAIAKLHDLQECIIRNIAWDEPAMRLTVTLDYIWTEDGSICFTQGLEPRKITLTFQLTTLLMINNALTAIMIEHPERLNWGISEIARLEIVPGEDLGVAHGFVGARFVWEIDRRIEVAFRQLQISLE
jgi:hypothetical protein